MPRVTLIMRKAFGGAFIAMNSKELGATWLRLARRADRRDGAEQAVGIVAPRIAAARPGRARRLARYAART